MKTRLMVGLEVHVELATRSKMFTGAPNVAHPDYDDAGPNTLLDPVVLGMPGVLPVVNERAVEFSMRVGLALGCEIAEYTKWDRKSYYYPDLPKNYQISQYDLPLCGAGEFELPLTDEVDGPTKPIRIIRAHLEEDAGKLLHEAPGGVAIDHSIVDLNRSGTPLLEIVTEPDFDHAEQVVRFGRMLRDICRHLGVSQGVMQMGHMRFEPNINVVIEREGEEYRTPVVEIKNLNSFKAVYGAIEHERVRQVEEWLESGRVMGRGAKSTRGWDDARGVTTHQREKEDAHDYRYFPDPDLVPLRVSRQWVDRVREEMTELPQERLKRYRVECKLDDKQARQIVDEPETCALFDRVLQENVAPSRAAAVLLNYGAKRANERGVAIHELTVTPKQIAEIVRLAQADKISSSGADELFRLCCDSANAEQSAEMLAQEHGLLQVSDTGSLEAYVDEVLADANNAKVI